MFQPHPAGLGARQEDHDVAVDQRHIVEIEDHGATSLGVDQGCNSDVCSVVKRPLSVSTTP